MSLGFVERARLYVVDRDLQLRESALSLRTLFEEIAPLDDASTVVSRSKRESPQLVIVELDAEPRGALHLIRTYRLAFPDRETPCLVVSPRPDDDTHIRCLDGGAADYLAKPIAPRLLLARVSAILRRSQPMRRVVEAARPRLRRSVVDVNGRPISIETCVVHSAEPFVRTIVRAGERELVRRQAKLDATTSSDELDAIGQQTHTEAERLVRERVRALRDLQGTARPQRRLFSDGVEHALAGQWSEALALWEQAQELDPDDGAVQANIDVARQKLAKQGR